MWGPGTRSFFKPLLLLTCLSFLIFSVACGSNSNSTNNNGGNNTGSNNGGTSGGSGGGGGTGGTTGGGGTGSGGSGGGTGTSGGGQTAATYLYVGNQGLDPTYFTLSKTPESISIFKVDPATSQISKVGGYGDETKWRADQIFIAGNWMLTTKTSGFSELKIDPATGKLSNQKEMSLGELINVTPGGKYAVIAENGNLDTFSVNQADGSLQKVSSAAMSCVPLPPNSQWDPTGQYFVTNNCAGTVVAVDSNTGALRTEAQNAEGLASAGQIGFDTTGKHYVSFWSDSQNGGEFLTYDFDPTTLTLTAGSTGPTVSDAFVFTIAGDYIYSRNITGHIFKMGGNPFAVTDTGMTFDPVSGWRQPFIVDTASNTAFIVSPQDNQVVALKVGSDGNLTRTNTGDTGTAPWVMAVAHF